MNTFSLSSIDGLCRTCMNERFNGINTCNIRRRNVSIFNKTDIFGNCKITIMDLLILTTPKLNVKNDDRLPKIMCERCVDILIKTHEFQQRSINTELQLRDIINKKETLIVQNNTNHVMDGGVTVINDTLKNEIDEPLIDNKDIHNFCDENNSNNLEYNLIDIDTSANNDDLNIDTANNKEKLDYDTTSVDEDYNSDKDVDWESKYINKRKKYTEINERFKTQVTLKKHKRLHLRKDKVNPATSIKNSEEDEKASYQFKCDECGSMLKTRKSLSRHKKIHLKTLIVKEQPTRTLTQTINECEYCKKIFQKPSILKDHILLHTGELPYLCSECGKSFRTASVLKQHLLRHGTEKPHICPDCPKCFSTISDLASHRSVHSKLKPYVCDVCGASFVKGLYLKEHKMYHTGEKNHKCDYCDRRFVTGYQCRRHMLTHTGEKPHKCKYCERAYTQSNELMKHLRTHLGDNVYKCTLCPQGYRLYSDLREHFNSHRHDDKETKLRNLQALQDDEIQLQIKLGLVSSS